MACSSSALLLTSAATATLLDNTAPIWVGIGAMIFFGERLRWRYWAGLGLALTGAAVVTGFKPTAGFRLNPGDVLALTGAIFMPPTCWSPNGAAPSSIPSPTSRWWP